MNIAEIRQKFPMYDDIPDGELVRGLHKKFYADIPYQDFLQKIDFREAAPDPTEGMGQGKLFMAGVGKSVVDTGRGVGQLVGAVDQAEVDEARALDEALNNTTAGTLGNIAGDIAQIALPGAAAMRVARGANSVRGMEVARSIMAPRTFTGSAAQGAVISGTRPVASDETRLGNAAKGAAGGMLGQGLVKAVPRAVRVARAAVEPLHEAGRERILSRVLQREAGGDPAVAQRLASAQELVPGSAPTAAEVSGNANIAALQRMAAQANPEDYARRAAQQNEARRTRLFDLAGTSGEREFHATSRATAANKLYDEAYVAGADIRRDAATGHFIPATRRRAIQGEITKLLKRPAVQEAVREARKLAANEGEDIGPHPFSSVRGMDYTVRALSDMIEQAGARQRGNEARILTSVKDRLLTTVDRISPKYELARKTFRDQSRHINQLDVAQDLADRAINPLTGQVQPQQFARLLSDDTAARVTGNSRATLANTLDPDRLAQLNAIRDDLARSVEARDLGRGPGSNTFQNFAMANMLEQAGVPSAVRRMSLPQIVGGVVGRVGNAAYSDADRQMRERLAQLLLNPQATAALMRAAPRELTAQQRALAEALRRGVVTGGAAMPAIASD